MALGDYARRYLIDSFSNIPGVGRVQLGGLRSLSVRVYLNPVLMAGNNITVNEIESALRRENIRMPSGSLEGGNLELSLSLEKAYKDLDSLKRLPIK